MIIKNAPHLQTQLKAMWHQVNGNKLGDCCYVIMKKKQQQQNVTLQIA